MAQPCVHRVLQSRVREGPVDEDRAYGDAVATMGYMELTDRPATTIVSLTQTAASKVKELMAEEPEEDASVLRVAVQGGGCSGFEYALGFDRGVQEGDHEMSMHGVTVVVDPFSAPYLRGAQIDFLNGLQESGFKIDNPNVAGSCGCGHSFQVDDEQIADDGGYAGGGCGSGCGH